MRRGLVELEIIWCVLASMSLNVSAHLYGLFTMHVASINGVMVAFKFFFHVLWLSSFFSVYFFCLIHRLGYIFIFCLFLAVIVLYAVVFLWTGEVERMFDANNILQNRYNAGGCWISSFCPFFRRFISAILHPMCICVCARFSPIYFRLHLCSKTNARDIEDWGYWFGFASNTCIHIK